MSANLTIRTMAGKDIYGIIEAWNETLVRDTITVGRFIRSVLLDINFSPTDARGCYVAETQGKIVGFIRVIMRLAPNDGLGFEEHDGWISVLFVRPEYQRKTIGTQLLHAGLDFLKSHGRRKIWVCGNTGSAPGYFFPGVDAEAYPSGFAFFKRHDFTVDHEPVAMSRDIIDFDYKKYYEEAWSTGKEDVVVRALAPERVQDFLAFLATHFKGDWNAAA
jgi:mycothiol synthase